MLRSSLAASLSTAAVPLFSLSPLIAQEEHDQSHDHEGHEPPEVVAYPLADWLEMHFDDAQQATEHMKTVKGRGCEVEQIQHAGHIDIVYRCAAWKEKKVATHKLADQWLGWMKASGFDTLHAHVSETFQHGNETIRLQLMDWKTAHRTGPDVQTAKEFATSLLDVGCSVKSHAHDDHADVSDRCPVWVTIHVEDHAAAEQWPGWLKSQGFETKHTHSGRQAFRAAL